MHAIVRMSLESGGFAAIGSVLCYLLFGDKSKGFDYHSLFIMIIWASICFTPIGYNWYPYLDTVVPGTEMSAVLMKVTMDQLIMAPILTLCFWFYSTFAATFEVGKAMTAAKKNTLNTLLSTWMYWPLVQLINIAFVPSESKVSVYYFSRKLVHL